MKDFARLKAKWNNRSTPPTPASTNSDNPLISGSGPTLLRHSACDLRAEAKRLRQLVSVETEKPRIIWLRLQEVRQALELKQAFGKAAVWPGEEPGRQIEQAQEPTMLQRVTTAVVIRARATSSENKQSLWRRK